MHVARCMPHVMRCMLYTTTILCLYYIAYHVAELTECCTLRPCPFHIGTDESAIEHSSGFFRTLLVSLPTLSTVTDTRTHACGSASRRIQTTANTTKTCRHAQTHSLTHSLTPKHTQHTHAHTNRHTRARARARAHTQSRANPHTLVHTHAHTRKCQ